MSEQRSDLVVIGGGIVGLSTAMHLTRQFPRLRLILLEKEDAVASHQTGHNSGVIHSGIYYQPGSLKARLCVEGAAAMVSFCRDHSLPYEVCGKVIVATTDAEIPRLHEIFQRGQINGLPNLRMLDAAQLREIEPHCGGLCGIHVPSTGIADYAAVSRKYAELITAQGGAVETGKLVTKIVSHADAATVETTSETFITKYVINCAGLHSDRVGKIAGESPDAMIVPFRGEYYDLVPEKYHLVRGLIYPVPDPRFPFLGVHFTRRVHGGVDAGPNAVLAFKREGYRKTDFSLRDTLGMLGYSGFWHMTRKNWRHGIGEFYRSFNKHAFVRSLQKLIPEIREEDLVRGGAGVRAQALRPDGSMVDDFQFTATGNMLHLYNVPSPAATASLPIGRTIAQMAQERFGLKN
jgi:L-2-hydroxyglutarate oxidase LhgO